MSKQVHKTSINIQPIAEHSGTMVETMTEIFDLICTIT
jgi:hypothetical protein